MTILNLGIKRNRVLLGTIVIAVGATLFFVSSHFNFGAAIMILFGLWYAFLPEKLWKRQEQTGNLIEERRQSYLATNGSAQNRERLATWLLWGGFLWAAALGYTAGKYLLTFDYLVLAVGLLPIVLSALLQLFNVVGEIRHRRNAASKPSE